MRLLLDLGNTRLKAALGDAGGAITLLGDARHREQGMAAALAAVLDGTTAGAAVAAAGADPAWCANVAGEAAGRALAQALQQRSGTALVFLKAGAEACGVRCAYADPSHLGADRWAALLGARGMTAGACLVVDAGSALTIDALAPGGRHLGGWIIPGLGMMLEALEGHTGDLASLRRASAAGHAAPFPADTGPAMEAGANLAAVGAVRAARARLETECGEPARLLLAGGDAEQLLAAFADAEHVPELVLQGLARAAAGVQAPS